MSSGLTQLSCEKFFDGLQYRYSHHSRENNWPMKFTVFLPPKALLGERCPVMMWLTGKTLGEFGFTNKSGFQRWAAELNMIVVTPEPTPRGIEEPDPVEGLPFGAQLGSYVDATTPIWCEHYRMYSYITKEFYDIVLDKFPVIREKFCLSGHSMGANAAIPIALQNLDKFASVTALSGNYNPIESEEGAKAFQLYLGSDREAWRPYDTCEVIRDYHGPPKKVLIDQGGGDSVSVKNFNQKPLLGACQGTDISLTYRIHSGYHHAYEYIQTFVKDHMEFHLKILNSIG
ncbi:S-formylglutathione hydrolase-like [Brevipalpus obovatus]|uniref:S-formylglutathione hydrolase-like n=1 Tax=Brevipalpus obovatus TaxID=246614 RepID=UPI003D9E0825